MNKTHRTGLTASIISGIMMGTSYIPFPPWALFFCFVPLMNHWLKETNPKKIFWTGWVCQFTLTLIGFNWVIYTIHEFGQMPWPIAFVGLMAFCSFANLHIPLAGLAWHFIFKRSTNPLVRVVSLVTFMAAAERLYPMIFDWNIGYTWLWAQFPAYHLADIFGFFGLSTITWFFQGAFLFTWAYLSGKQRYAGLLTSLFAFALLNVIGWFHSPEPNSFQKIKVAVIQANIGNLEKQMAEIGFGFRQSIIDRYLHLSRKETAQNPDFYLWPETAYPDFLSEASYIHGVYGPQIRSFLSETNGTLLTGTYGLTRQNQMTNSFAALGKDGFLADLYHKTHLLAFGEFIPGAQFFPQLKTWLPMVADFKRGPGPTVMTVNGIPLGVQICYEGLFDRFSRKLAAKGAWVIINVTNDSWYGTWQEPHQHLTMTLARAIEVRLPLIRATNTGISTVQLPTGETLEKSPLAAEWSHTYEVPYSSSPKRTLFTGFGYWVFPFFLVALLIWSLWNRRRA